MTFEQWKSLDREVRARASRINRMKHNRGWKLAASVGIGRCGCSLHNASIASVGAGWGAGPDGRRRIRVARAAARLVNCYEASRIAERISRRAWESVE